MSRPAPFPAASAHREHLIVGACLLGTTALAVPLMPGPLVALGLVLGVLRLLWLEENIFDDLLLASRRRAGPGRGPDGTLARATAMRAEAQAWSVALLGMGASLAWLGLGGASGLLGWALAFGLGLRRVDRLAGTLDLIAAGRTLDADHLRRPVPAALSTPPRDRRRGP